MSLIVEQGKERFLQLIKDNAAWQAKLYSAPTAAPASSDVLTDYTLATFSGSDAINLNSWGLISDNSDRGQMTHTPITWTCSATPGSPQTVYGYVVFDGSSNLIWATKEPRTNNLVKLCFVSPDVTATMTKLPNSDRIRAIMMQLGTNIIVSEPLDKLTSLIVRDA